MSKRSSRTQRRHRGAELRLECLEERALLAAIADPPVQLSYATPFTNPADTSGQSGSVYLNAATEPNLAVDPNKPLDMVAVWQQDRWSNGGSRGIMTGVTFDGGQTWSTRPLPGATVNTGGVTQRASDPWVSISPNGVVYVSSLPLNDPATSSTYGVFVSESTTGGLSWGDPIAVVTNTSNLLTNDKETITADPTNPNYAYVVWDRLNNGGVAGEGPGPTLFSETANGGVTWTAPADIFDPPGGQTLDNEIVVLPNGTLVNMFENISNGSNAGSIEVITSTDKGHTWSGASLVGVDESVSITDPDNGQPIRGGDSIPQIAVDRNSGALYVVWQDGRFSGRTHDDIAFSESTDGGKSWTVPTKVNQTPPNLSTGNSQTFDAAIAVAKNGMIAVSYFDFRNNTGAGGLLTDRFIAFAQPSSTGIQFGQEARQTPASFDLELAPVAGGYFLGDYMSMAAGGASGNTFGTVFPESISGNVSASMLFELSAIEPNPRPILVSAAGPGMPSEIKAYDGATGALLSDFDAYDPRFLGGVHVAVGDLNGDGVPDIITAPGPGGGPDIRIFNGFTGALENEFLAYSPLFTGGVWVAAGDVTGRGYADLVVGADAGGTPEVKIFDGVSGARVADFLGLPVNNHGGARVAVGDINGDGHADIIVASGSGDTPLVNVFSGLNGSLLRSFSPYSPLFKGGVYVAAGDVDGDGLADIITGAGAGGGPHVEVFSGTTGTLIRSFMAYSKTFNGGVRVAAQDVNGDGRADIITVPGAGIGPQVEIRDAVTLAILQTYFAYAPSFAQGIFVAAPVSSVRAFPSAMVTGADAGGGPDVRVFDPLTGQLRLDFEAYDPRFLGGVRVAIGDVTGDGIPDIVTAPGPGGTPDIRVFNSLNGALEREFLAYSPAFTGGVFVAVGDFTGGGIDEILTGADAGGGPEVKIFNALTGATLADFLPFVASFSGGVRVAAGDVNGDGRPDIICAAGPGGTPTVSLFSGVNGSLIRTFNAFDPTFAGGVYVAAGDTNGDGVADILCGAGKGGTPSVRVFSGATGAILQSFMAFPTNFAGGVRVAAFDTGNGLADFITAAGPGGTPLVIVHDGLTAAVIDNFYAYSSLFPGGVFVGGQ